MKTKRMILFLTGIFMLTDLFSQTKLSLTGKVTDAISGQPLPGATIYIPDMRKGAAANNEGLYAVSNIPAGKHLVEITHLGYTSVIETMDFNTDTKKDFALSPSVVENENITVTGVSSATSVKRMPVPVNIIKRENLFSNIASNLIDNISKTPGVAQVSTGPAISKPFIRGLGYNRVVVVNDGLRQEGQQWGDEHGTEIDEQSVNKVEILKGPASLMYGSDALAGVVNIISIVPSPEGSLKGNISTAYFSNNRQRNFHADLGGNKNGFTWGFNVSYKAAADYKNKYDGYVFNSKFNEKNIGAYIGLNKSWGYSHWHVSNFDQALGLVEGDRDDATGKFLKLVNDNGVAAEAIATNNDFRSTDPFIPKQRIQHLKFASDNSFRIGKNRLTAMLGYQSNQRHEFGNVLDPAENSLHFDLGTFNYNLQFLFLEKKDLKTTIGLNGLQQSNKNKGVEQLIPEYSLFDLGFFVYMQKRYEKLTLSGGMRFDNRSVDSKELLDGPNIKFAAFKKDFANVSGSIGIAYQANKTVNLKFNIARGFRAPAIPELASNGAHEGTNRFEYGEQGLKSETSLQVDAGIEAASEHVSFTANLFYNAMHNFIYYRKLNSVNGGDSIIMNGSETFLAFRFTQDNAALYGAEFNLDIHPHPLDWLHIENTFSWVRGKLNKEQDGSRDLPFIPATRLINELKVDLLKKGKTIKNVFLKMELDNNFAQKHPFTGYNTETASSGYSLLNAGLGGEIKSKDKTIVLFFIGANNIADAAYQDHLSRLKYAPPNLVTGRIGVFNMGRNFSIKLNVPLDFMVN